MTESVSHAISTLFHSPKPVFADTKTSAQFIPTLLNEAEILYCQHAHVVASTDHTSIFFLDSSEVNILAYLLILFSTSLLTCTLEVNSRKKHESLWHADGLIRYAFSHKRDGWQRRNNRSNCFNGGVTEFERKALQRSIGGSFTGASGHVANKRNEMERTLCEEITDALSELSFGLHFDRTRSCSKRIL